MTLFAFLFTPRENGLRGLTGTPVYLVTCYVLDNNSLRSLAHILTHRRLSSTNEIFCRLVT